MAITFAQAEHLARAISPHRLMISSMPASSSPPGVWMLVLSQVVPSPRTCTDGRQRSAYTLAVRQGPWRPGEIAAMVVDRVFYALAGTDAAIGREDVDDIASLDRARTLRGGP